MAGIFKARRMFQPPGKIRSKPSSIWEEHRTPDVVIEITSKSTGRVDETVKPNTYRSLDVKEMFLYDPLGDSVTGERLLKEAEEEEEAARQEEASARLATDRARDEEQLRIAAEAELVKMRLEIEKLKKILGDQGIE